ETVVAERSPQAVDSPPDLRARFGRSGNVKRPALATELKLDVAGVHGDVAEQRLHRRIVGVRRQSERVRVGGRLAQQFARIGRIDRGERSGRAGPIEETFHLVFIQFTEQRVLDAETIGVDQETAQRDAARAGLAAQEHHPHAAAEHAILHEARVQGPNRGASDLARESAAALGLKPAALRQEFLSLGGLRMSTLGVCRGHLARNSLRTERRPWPRPHAAGRGLLEGTSRANHGRRRRRYGALRGRAKRGHSTVHGLITVTPRIVEFPDDACDQGQVVDDRRRRNDRLFRERFPPFAARAYGEAVVLHALAAAAIWTAPPSSIASRRPLAPPPASAKTAPSAATPIAAPDMRATLMSEAAVPARAAGTAATASPASGPVARPMPRPVSARPISAPAIPPAAAVAPMRMSPQPMTATPPAIMIRAPMRSASGPESGDVAT